MTRRLKSIAPLQLGKMLAALYGAMGLIFVPFFLLFGALAAFIPQQEGTQAMPAVFGVGMGLAMAVMAPLLYAAMGFVIGVIGAFIYNLIAKWIGGIEVEVE